VVLVNRRNFVKGASAVIVPVVFLGPRLSAIAVARSMSASITAVIYDERYCDCSAFAEALRRQGATAFPANGDSASLWYGALRAQLLRHGGRVAGFTTHSDLGVSQSCGRELQLKMLYQGAHDCRASSSLTHRLRGRVDQQIMAAAFTGGNASWPRRLARILCHIPGPDSGSTASPDDSADRATWEETSVTTSRSGDHPGYLTSWLLAPDIRLCQSISC
jgi:hypothetical protein